MVWISCLQHPNPLPQKTSSQNEILQNDATKELFDINLLGTVKRVEPAESWSLKKETTIISQNKAFFSELIMTDFSSHVLSFYPWGCWGSISPLSLLCNSYLLSPCHVAGIQELRRRPCPVLEWIEVLQTNMITWNVCSIFRDVGIGNLTDIKKPEHFTSVGSTGFT